MKKFFASALTVALIGVSVSAIAHSGAMDHSQMQSMRQSMQEKMRSAKTDEERQALMAEQRKLMQGQHDSTMPMPGHSGGHDMKQMQGHKACM